MKQSLTKLIILLGFSSTLIAQSNDNYRVLMTSENPDSLEIYDTIITLDFLSDLNDDSLPNMQFFYGFDYPKFKKSTKGNKIVLSNDSLKITLETESFDSMRYAKYYLADSLSNYYDSPYFREHTTNFNGLLFHPETEVSKIVFQIKNKKIYPSKEFYLNLYNIETSDVNAYVAGNGKILLYLFCGEGAAAYITIFLFDSDGVFERRIEEPVL